MRFLLSLLLCLSLSGPMLAKKIKKPKRGPAATWGAYKQPKAKKWKPQKPKAPKMPKRPKARKPVSR